MTPHQLNRIEDVRARRNGELDTVLSQANQTTQGVLSLLR